MLFFKTYSQCNQTQPLVICDITTIDGNNDGEPDGILNLYDEYFKLTGNTLENGTWKDPNSYFALTDATSGNINIWNLPSATTNDIQPYSFQLFTTSCGDTPAVTIQISLGAFSGFAAEITEDGDSNLRVCYTKESQNCNREQFFDLLRALGPLPSAHDNGTWEYIGSSPNFRELNVNNFSAVIPYEPGGNLIDQDFFDFTYTVNSNISCKPTSVTNVRVSVVRGVNAGQANTLRICEDDLQSGNYNNDINLRDNDYLLGEDVEGIWLFNEDETNQITSRTDSFINLKEVYDSLYQNNPRFESKIYDYKYSVRDRSNLCGNDTASVNFVFIEKIRAFKAKDTLPSFCIGERKIGTIDLYEMLEFTTENGVLYDYPKIQGVNYWEIQLNQVQAETFKIYNPYWKIDPDTFLATCYVPKIKVNLSYLTDTEAGEYKFTYTVPTSYNVEKNEQVKYSSTNLCLPFLEKGVCETTETATIQFKVFANTYAGEDTTNLELCESSFKNPVNLFSLLNSTKPIQTNGEWTNDDTKKVVENPFVLPTFSEDTKNFNFTYTTQATDSCNTSAKLQFSVFKPNLAGEGGTISFCKTDTAVDLFSLLKNNPSTKGKWTLPDGSISEKNSLIFDPKTTSEGIFTYKTDAILDQNGMVLCEGESVTLTVNITKIYAGENTTDLEFCESKFTSPINLEDLLEKNPQETFNANGIWTNVDTGETVTSPFTLPLISDEQTFNFTYSVTKETCTAKATLSFTVFEKFSAGTGVAKTYCSNNETEIMLFDLLENNPSDKGYWLLPDGTTNNDLNFSIKPNTISSGIYTYVIPATFDSKNSELCSEEKSEINITIQEKPSAGDDVESNICYTTKEFDLFTLLNNHTSTNGNFYNKANEQIPSGIINISELLKETHTFTYKIDDDAICQGDEAIITLNLYGIDPPKAENQTFCPAKRYPIVDDLKVEGNYEYLWYSTNEATTALTNDTILLDGEDYFVEAIDETGCASKRTKIVVTYLPVGSENCDPCFSDGISINGDGINDFFDLCNLSNLFPNFTLEIFNRLGILVYRGTKETPNFSGKANTPNLIGGNGRLPSGVYFYIFYPNDNATKPIQSDFYLGR